MSFTRYLVRKLAWSAGALAVAVFLNFLLPRLIPGNPIDAIVSSLGRGGAEAGTLKAVKEAYTEAFGLDKSMVEQFFIYVNNLLHGDLGKSFTTYPQTVGDLIGEALPWTIALQLPAILIGWIVGNILGALAAYKSGWFDRGAFISSLFVSSVPYYCVAILLLYVFAVVFPVLPPGGGYSFGTTPEWTSAFAADALEHYWLPFLSLLVVFIGGQAVGMRSMAIYELGSDYVNYSRGMGLRDSKIVRYIFRNAMLPQITGLAISIATMVSGAVITEIVFSYPGVGTLLFNAISQTDYPVISGVTLILTVMVLAANFLVDIACGIIDPRIRAAGGVE
ncbi:MAG: ABC transporter permease [Dactylosporangium sp.]|nr:ABC transporter permease [Dactylosporangium sp.]NNJ60655.1 ABC transporter permease [Dactylosporangium sp.]